MGSATTERAKIRWKGFDTGDDTPDRYSAQNAIKQRQWRRD